MRTRLAALPVLGALVAATAVGVALPTSAAQAAGTQCTYTPVLAKRIVVNRPTINFHTPVRIKGAGCARNFAAAESLTHRTDTYYLNWTYNSTTASDAVYAITVVPGVYRTAADSSCSATAEDGSMLTCSVGAGSTVIKFGGRVGLSATRLTGSAHRRKQVRFSVKAAHYAQYTTAYMTTTVRIQRYYSKHWHTIHTGTAKGSHGYVWTHTDPDAGTYRAVSSETGSTFAGTSRTVTR